jgi:hypothetical protein
MAVHNYLYALKSIFKFVAEIQALTSQSFYSLSSYLQVKMIYNDKLLLDAKVTERLLALKDYNRIVVSSVIYSF